jgi:hypothetical protein
MAGPGNILIKIGAEAGQAISELSTVNRALGDTMSSSEKMGAGLKKAAVPAAAALVAIGAGAISAAKAAAEDAAEQERLAGVLERSTGATQAQVAANEDWIASLSKATGVADDELRPALAKLAMATGDVHLAQKDLQTALDVSAATGKSVEQVSAAIAKGYTGQTTALNKLVPGLDQATLKSKDMSAVMTELADKTGGAMAAQAETATGQFAIFTNQMNELKETLGAALLPVLDALLPVLNKFASFAADNTTAIKVLIGVVAALASGILVANAAMKVYAAGQTIVKVATAAWTAAQWLLNAALSANPIGLVIVAVAALAAGIVIAYTRSQTFRDIVSAAFNAVAAAARAVASAFQSLLGAATSAFNWIVSHWKVAAFAFGPLGAAIVVIASNFDKVKEAGTAAFNAIESAIGAVSSAIQSVIGAVQSLIGWLGRIHVPHINLPGPLLAPVPSPGARGLRLAGAPSSSSAPVTVNVYGAIDPEGTARAIRRILSDHDRRLGR